MSGKGRAILKEGDIKTSDPYFTCLVKRRVALPMDAEAIEKAKSGILWEESKFKGYQTCCH